MKLLLVEDEARTARFVARGLREEGHVVDVAADGVAGEAMARGSAYDVILLDVMLPKRSGFHLAASLRAAGSSTPILMLTARDAREDIVHGLDAGADDYLTKPFDFEELLARIRALGRRADAIDESVLRYDDVELDLSRRIARRGDRRLRLTPIEFKLLEALMRKPGASVRRQELLDRVWGVRFDPGTNVVDVHVANLRRKLEAGGGDRVISTVRGVGFRLGPESGDAAR